MLFGGLQPGRLIKRYKRFLADVTLPDGSVVTAHCPNTGAMTGCACPGDSVWLSASDNPKRKLKWTLELVESQAGLVCVHSALANRVVEEALAQGLPDALSSFTSCRREVRYGAGSRADFLLEVNGDRVFVEVKAVTLIAEDGGGLFPDAVSERARKHLGELENAVAAGDRAALVYCSLHNGIESVAPATKIDPLYAEALTGATARGVEVYALKTLVSPDGIEPVGLLPVCHQ